MFCFCFFYDIIEHLLDLFYFDTDWGVVGAAVVTGNIPVKGAWLYCVIGIGDELILRFRRGLIRHNKILRSVAVSPYLYIGVPMWIAPLITAIGSTSVCKVRE